MGIKRGDMVEVKKGADAWDPAVQRGRGRVLKVFPETDRVIVEGVRMVMKHQRKSREYPEGGRIRKEAAMSVSNVMLVCPKCDRGVRVGSRKDDAGKKVRVCRRCGEAIPEPSP